MKTGGRTLKAAILLISLFVLAGCDDERPPADAGWRASGSPSKDQAMRFVVIDHSKSKDRASYNAAARWFCHDHQRGTVCALAFFLPGDRLPPNDGSKVRVTPIGGWEKYSEPIAVYWADGAGGEFKEWDCLRAGEKGAPATALCGSLKQINNAVSKLAMRSGFARACKLPPNSDEEKVRAYIGGIGNAEQQSMLQKTYDLLNGWGRIDGVTCERKRERVEQDAADARKLLGF